MDATTESGEPEHSEYYTSGEHSVWWSWTAPSDGDVTVDTCGSNYPTLLAIYTGSSVEALTPVAYNDFAFDGCGPCGEACSIGGSKLSFTAQSGQVYRFAVDGLRWESPPDNSTGSIVLALNKSVQPANDDFANAAVLTEDTGYGWLGTNAGASKEAGEPNHAGDAGGHSVWSSSTAPGGTSSASTPVAVPTSTRCSPSTPATASVRSTR